MVRRPWFFEGPSIVVSVSGGCCAMIVKGQKRHRLPDHNSKVNYVGSWFVREPEADRLLNLATAVFQPPPSSKNKSGKVRRGSVRDRQRKVALDLPAFRAVRPCCLKRHDPMEYFIAAAPAAACPFSRKWNLTYLLASGPAIILQRRFFLPRKFCTVERVILTICETLAIFSSSNP